MHNLRFTSLNVINSLIKRLDNRLIWILWVLRCSDESLSAQKKNLSGSVQNGLTQANADENSSKISSNASMCMLTRLVLAIRSAL